MSELEAMVRTDDEHLRLLLAFALGSDSNCIDVGAHTGSVLKDILHFAPNGRHIAYEPLPHLCDSLRSAFPSVDVRCAAASNIDGESTFVHVVDDPAYSGLRKRPDLRPGPIESIVVRTERLDDHLPANYVPSLIKIDVEGAQQLVLEGASRTLRRFKPVVVFEHGADSAAAYGTRSSDVFGLLAEIGLRIFDLDGNGPYSLSRFESSIHWNFVAHV
jgi:FkbM family methyltransferase